MEAPAVSLSKGALLGWSDLRVSRIALGTSEFGTTIGEAQARALLDAYVDAGGRFIDTADTYGDWASDEPGASERAIGRWLRERPFRDDLVVATKCGVVFEHRALVRVDLSAEWIERSVRASLLRLGLERIDLLWLHRDAPEVPVARILEAVAPLIERGLVRHVGCSNWSAVRLSKALDLARDGGLPRIVASQAEWSLARRIPGSLAGSGLCAIDEKARRLHLESGLPLVAYSAQARGFFGTPTPPSSRSRVRALGDKLLAPIGIDPDGRRARAKVRSLEACYGTAENRARRARAAALSQARGVSATQIAVAWLLAQPFPVVPLVGCRAPNQLHDVLATTTIALTPVERDGLGDW